MRAIFCILAVWVAAIAQAQNQCPKDFAAQFEAASNVCKGKMKAQEAGLPVAAGLRIADHNDEYYLRAALLQNVQEAIRSIRNRRQIPDIPHGPPEGKGGPPEGKGGPPEGKGGPPEGNGGRPEGKGRQDEKALHSIRNRRQIPDIPSGGIEDGQPKGQFGLGGRPEGQSGQGGRPEEQSGQYGRPENQEGKQGGQGGNKDNAKKMAAKKCLDEQLKGIKFYDEIRNKCSDDNEQEKNAEKKIVNCAIKKLRKECRDELKKDKQGGQKNGTSDEDSDEE